MCRCGAAGMLTNCIWLSLSVCLYVTEFVNIFVQVHDNSPYCLEGLRCVWSNKILKVWSTGSFLRQAETNATEEALRSHSINAHSRRHSTTNRKRRPEKHTVEEERKKYENRRGEINREKMTKTEMKRENERAKERESKRERDGDEANGTKTYSAKTE